MKEQMTKQDAIETLKIFRNDYIREDSAMCRAISIALDALRQSKVEAEPVRQGRWAYGYNSESCMLCHFCTACGKEAYWDTDYGQQLFEFCPNCGARMGRGDDDD